jgi:hypothetical protein
MPLGFSSRETLRGSYWLLDAPTDERAISVSIEAVARDLAVFARDKILCVTGTIDAERLASARPLEGKIAFRLLDERRISHHFRFVGENGAAYQLLGQKEFRGLSPIDSLTLLPASLCDDEGEEIGRATLRLDLRADWAAWVKNFRVRWEW